jgi:hypothetical protein
VHPGPHHPKKSLASHRRCVISQMSEKSSPPFFWRSHLVNRSSNCNTARPTQRHDQRGLASTREGRNKANGVCEKTAPAIIATHLLRDEAALRIVHLLIRAVLAPEHVHQDEGALTIQRVHSMFTVLVAVLPVDVVRVDAEERVREPARGRHEREGGVHNEDGPDGERDAEADVTEACQLPPLRLRKDDDFGRTRRLSPLTGMLL